jgi:hypothetical protein
MRKTSSLKKPLVLSLGCALAALASMQGGENGPEQPLALW